MNWELHQSAWSNDLELVASGNAVGQWYVIYCDFVLYKYYRSATGKSHKLCDYFLDPSAPSDEERSCFSLEIGIEYPNQQLLNELKIQKR